MKSWTSKLIVFIFPGLFYLVGIYFSQPKFSNQCLSVAYGSCLQSFSEGIGWTLLVFGSALTLGVFISLFANTKGWVRWLKFSFVYSVFTATFLVFLTPMSIYIDTYANTDKFAELFGFYLYIPITVLIVSLSYIPSRKNKKQIPPLAPSWK